MLNKSNRKLYKSLRGEYKRYARRLKDTLFDCCRGKDAVNDSLSDVFTMLAEAQGAHRAFADVIPDPHASIRETALCFPARRMRRNTAVILCLCAALFAVTAAAITVFFTSPIPLEGLVLNYDEAELTLYWNAVPHAKTYNISVNDQKLAETAQNTYRLDAEYVGNVLAEDGLLEFTVTAAAGGRYRKTTGTLYYRPEHTELDRTVSCEELFSDTTIANLSYPSGIYNAIRIHFAPQYNLNISVSGDVHSLTTNSYALSLTKEDLLLTAGTNYTLEITPESTTFNSCVTAYVQLRTPYRRAMGTDPTLPEGITLFAADESLGTPFDKEQFDLTAAHTAQGFRFAPFESFPADIATTQWFPAYFPYADFSDTHSSSVCFWLVENIAGKETELIFKENVIADVLKERTSYIISRGWTTLHLQIETGQEFTKQSDYFALFFPLDTDVMIFNTDTFGPILYSSPNSLYLYNFPSLESSRFLCLTIFTPDTTEITCEFYQSTLDMQTVTSQTLSQGSVTLQPGISFFRNATEAIVKFETIQTSHLFCVCSELYYISSRQFSTIGTYRMEEFESGICVYNPYDEPITLRLTAYYPQMN